jgi:phosphoribosylformimino-5-aminoimidazole carboxamide ribotide isomerase
LDAARGNRDNNRKKLRKIRRAFSGRIEVGGGIRTEDDIEELLDIGIDRLVVGTVFVTNYRRVEGWIQHYGNIFIAGIDALDGRVRVSGWEEETDFEDETIAERAQRIGICSIIYTNIARDGTLEGPDIEATLRIGRVSGLPMIHSGGIRNLEDIGALREASDSVIKGVIVGKALYEDGIDLGKAIETYQENGGNTEEW